MRKGGGNSCVFLKGGEVVLYEDFVRWLSIVRLRGSSYIYFFLLEYDVEKVCLRLSSFSFFFLPIPQWSSDNSDSGNHLVYGNVTTALMGFYCTVGQETWRPNNSGGF